MLFLQEPLRASLIDHLIIGGAGRPPRAKPGLDGAPRGGTLIMENSLFIGLIVFTVIMAGALTGLGISQFLPARHLSNETQSFVSLSMAVVATVSALVLGLLISNASTSFATYGREVTELSAKMLRLDRLLRHYGPEAAPARVVLQEYAKRKAAELFPDDPAKVSLGEPPATYQLLERVEDAVLALKPTSAREQWLVAQALADAARIGEMRWILRQQVEQEIPGPVVGLLAFWLTVLFASFGLFAPRNVVSVITLTLCALVVAGAVGMILELEKGFGLVRVSPAPMRYAVKALQAAD